MSKKDYIKFAEMFRAHLKQVDSQEQLSMLNSIMTEACNIFQADNPQFDRVRFKNAVYEYREPKKKKTKAE